MRLRSRQSGLGVRAIGGLTAVALLLAISRSALGADDVGTGSCCLPDGSCAVLTQSQCDAVQGDFRGVDTICEAQTCVLTGACCLGQGLCSVLSEPLCVGQGGFFQGDGIECGVLECPELIGACCFPDRPCTEGPRIECILASGDYQGHGMECAQIDCPFFSCPCSEDTNDVDRIRDDNAFETDAPAKAARCPQIVEDVIDVANTNPDIPVGTVENPFWDPATRDRSAPFHPFEFEQANVNILELHTCLDERCGDEHASWPQPDSPPLNGCVDLTGTQPGVVYGKVGTEVQVSVRQRCLLQQKLDPRGDPIRDASGRPLTAPLCVRGYQVWIRFDPALLELTSVNPVPFVGNGCITKRTPFIAGVAFSIDNVTGRGFAAAGTEVFQCPSAHDAVIAIFTFRVKAGNGDARVRFDEDHIAGQIADPDLTPAIQWTTKVAGKPVLPNLQNSAKVIVDNQPPIIESCPANLDGPIESDSLDPFDLIASGFPVSDVRPIVAGQTDAFDAPACTTFADEVGCRIERTWTVTDCAGNVAPCPVQLINEMGMAEGPVPRALGLEPRPNAVVNRASGVRTIAICYDRAVTVDSIEVTGVVSGDVTSDGTLTGNGTETITLEFAEPLANQDRYTVVVATGDSSLQWEFVTLIGDCNGDAVVNIFDLGLLRTALRAGTFDPECDIRDDGTINIFDLAHVRAALRDGASAP